MFFNLRERSSSIDKIRDPVRVPTEFQPASKVFAWCGRQNHLRRQCGWTGGCGSPLFRAAYRQNRPAPPDRRPKESNAVSYYFRTNFTVSYRQNCRSAHPPPTTGGTNNHYNIPPATAKPTLARRILMTLPPASRRGGKSNGHIVTTSYSSRSSTRQESVSASARNVAPAALLMSLERRSYCWIVRRFTPDFSLSSRWVNAQYLRLI